MDTPPRPKKSLGQHWLYDEASLQAMCNAAKVAPHDTILEVGPGLGTLTAYLLEQAKQVIAIEFDQVLARELAERMQTAKLKVVTDDILRFDLTTVPQPYKMVANIPYYLTSNLIRVISESHNPPETAVLLIQKEVAQRVVARPGQMSLLSVTAQYYWHASLDQEVPPEMFTPPPKVDSQILVLVRRTTPLFENVDTATFFRLVKAGFSQRRKTLLNSLSAGLQRSKGEILALCETANIDSRRRAQTLSLDEWHQLYRVLDT